nr:putative quinol monooxygenase [uncultured Trichococcus sp.]
MILINAEFYIKPEQKQQFLTEVTSLIKESRKEKGCIAYQLYQAIANEHDYVMIEKWESQQAIESHNEEPHLQEFAEEIQIFSRKAPKIIVNLAKD